jgi:hypothetical protein
MVGGPDQAQNAFPCANGEANAEAPGCATRGGVCVGQAGEDRSQKQRVQTRFLHDPISCRTLKLLVEGFHLSPYCKLYSYAVQACEWLAHLNRTFERVVPNIDTGYVRLNESLRFGCI